MTKQMTRVCCGAGRLWGRLCQAACRSIGPPSTHAYQLPTCLSCCVPHCVDANQANCCSHKPARCKTFVMLTALQNPATAATAASLSWFTGLKTFPHPTISTVSVLGQVLGPFVFAACMFSFVTQISAVVMEKEGGLKQVGGRLIGLYYNAFFKVDHRPIGKVVGRAWPCLRFALTWLCKHFDTWLERSQPAAQGQGKPSGLLKPADQIQRRGCTTPCSRRSIVFGPCSASTFLRLARLFQDTRTPAACRVPKATIALCAHMLPPTSHSLLLPPARHQAQQRFRAHGSMTNARRRCARWA